jgi:hypothetical protein
MVKPCSIVYVDIMNKYFEELISPILKDVNHGPLECACGIFYLERHYTPLV